MACQKTPAPIDLKPRVNWSDSITLYGSASLGLDLYLDQPELNGLSCVNCHLSPSGFDLVFFGKSNASEQDSIIIQRAVFDLNTGHGHVSLEDAYHIAAYLRSLRISSQTIPNDNANNVRLNKTNIKDFTLNMFGRLVLILICHLSYKKYYSSLLYFFSI